MMDDRWCGPEILLGTGNYNEKSDVFAFGVTIWEIFTRGGFPYAFCRTNHEVVIFVTEGHRLDIDEKWPPVVQKVLQESWAQNPEERPVFKVLHGWLTNTVPTDEVGPIVLKLSDGKKKKDYEKSPGNKPSEYSITVDETYEKTKGNDYELSQMS
jgi:hypothetical protein